MKSKRILITGGAGFVGSYIAMQLKKSYPQYDVICMDNLRRRGSELHLAFLKSAGIHFLHGDIRIVDDFDCIPAIDCIIEASAEPSVQAGITSGLPNYVLQTNLVGTINCLNVACKHKADFIFLSTSRVYPIEALRNIAYSESETRFQIRSKQNQPGISANGVNEQFTLNGYRSFYGATKLSSELLIAEYQQFYGLKAVINRCGVIAGPGQMGKTDQGVFVLWAARHFWKKTLQYIGYEGSGKQVRDVLHIADLAELVLLQLHEIDVFKGNTFNIGGGYSNSISLLELTKICQNLIKNQIPIESIPKTQSTDIPIYITDNQKIEALCNWKPERNVEQLMYDIYNWLKASEAQLKPILDVS